MRGVFDINKVEKKSKEVYNTEGQYIGIDILLNDNSASIKKENPENRIIFHSIPLNLKVNYEK